MQRRMTVARPKSSRVMIQQSLASGLGKAIAKRFGVPATVPKDKPIEVATLGAFERPHLIPSGNRRDPYDDPFDTASNAVELGIHGARFLQLYFGANCLTRGLI
jgi:hypothetical protein